MFDSIKQKLKQINLTEATEYKKAAVLILLLKENDEYKIGSIKCKVINTPGHTPACTAHVIGNSIFVGDTLFMPDLGSARADFPGGDARELYRSIQKILSYPDDTLIFVCHDYPPTSRKVEWVTTVGCLLYTSPSPRDRTRSRMPSSA